MSKKRKRNVLIKFYVYPEEKILIEKKMELSKYPSISSYLRQAGCYNKVVIHNYDFGDFKVMSKELFKIGVSINQIAARVNSTGNIYKEDIDFLKNCVEKIYQRQRNIISRLP